MSAAQPHISAVAKNNPNHDEHGRFASSEGGDADHLADDDEDSYQDEDQKKSDRHDESFESTKPR